MAFGRSLDPPPGNTRQMSLAPQRNARMDEIETDEEREADRPVTLRLCVSGDLFTQAVPYGCVVERWEYCKFGKGRRAWLKAFTDAERAAIGRLHVRMHKWHLVTGTPQTVVCSTKSLDLMKRACAFFASV